MSTLDLKVETERIDKIIYSENDDYLDWYDDYINICDCDDRTSYQIKVSEIDMLVKALLMAKKIIEEQEDNEGLFNE